MMAFHGCTVANLVRLIRTGGPDWLSVTSEENAGRYANAQATQVVDPRYLPLAEGAVVLGVEIPDDTNFIVRPESHHTLDTLEAVVPFGRYRVVSARLRFHPYAKTRYGTGWDDAILGEEVVALLLAAGIDMEI